MKIGIDARLWNESGVGRYIRNLTKGIDTRKTNDEFVIFLTEESYGKAEFKNTNLSKVKSKSHWHTVSEQWTFKRELEKENLDLVHFPYFSYPILYKRPFVITIHDLIIDHFPTGMSSSLPFPFYTLKRLGYKKVISSSIKDSKKIIVPSFATKKEILDHYKADDGKISVIYEGFDPEIKSTKNTNLVSKNYILYVGNAYPHKNLNKLIEAFINIRKEHNIDLVCIGRDDFFYRRLEKRKPEGVYFLHNIDDSVLFDYYMNARLFVMPSIMEGFGLPILEAMNLSCPVVCSNTPALYEIGKDGCSYFDPESTTDIENVITRVLLDKNLAHGLAEKGKKRSQEFSWDDCVEKTLGVYESCNSLRQG